MSSDILHGTINARQMLFTSKNPKPLDVQLVVSSLLWDSQQSVDCCHAPSRYAVQDPLPRLAWSRSLCPRDVHVDVDGDILQGANKACDNNHLRLISDINNPKTLVNSVMWQIKLQSANLTCSKTLLCFQHLTVQRHLRRMMAVSFRM